MLESTVLKHEFDMTWFSPLDIDQVHYLFFYLIHMNQFLAPQSGNGGQPEANSGAVHSWEDLAFYINSKCPDSPAQSIETYRTAWDNFKKIPHAREPESQWRMKYSRLTQTFPDLWLTCMNYGYYDFETNNKGLELNQKEEGWRFAIQLYHRLIGDTQLKDKDLLEIGCGRGGGASFISRYHEPASYTATDGTMSNVMFCERAHDAPNLKFQWSKAEKLPFDDKAFDVVINVESCNYYEPFNAFASGVHRVLRPDGYFLLTMFDTPNNMRAYSAACQNNGFELLQTEDMTFNVAMAIKEFAAGKNLFANQTTIRRKLMYLEHWRGIYNVPPILSGHARFCRFIFKKK